MGARAVAAFRLGPFTKVVFQTFDNDQRMTSPYILECMNGVVLYHSGAVSRWLFFRVDSVLNVAAPFVLFARKNDHIAHYTATTAWPTAWLYLTGARLFTCGGESLSATRRGPYTSYLLNEFNRASDDVDFR